MSLLEKIGLPLIRSVDPERAHGLALSALRAGLGPRTYAFTTPRLRTVLAGMSLENPIGLAAGFDKNAVALPALHKTAFGFLEVGAATPKPQPGNPKPRLFRLTEDAAAINRFGFNNDGMVAINGRLKDHKGVVGLNLGANKDSADRAQDFAQVLSHCGSNIDFATVNVSSPNTEKLRDLQGKAALQSLLAGVIDASNALDVPIPIFLKIAPDLTSEEIAEIADVANTSSISGLIATNTTLSREGLKSAHAGEKGGLSGQPLFEKSTRVLAELSTQTHLPIIGVGGVSNAQQAYTKIRAGASAVQLYTAMVFSGVSLVHEIAVELDKLLIADGFKNVSYAVGVDKGLWT
ncbi:dihydroorotate oxidase A [Cognatiyoonia sediminum]|uniref:Dihydroorotate dehydrogenase (quinone) n=1 Tax=Cognatiyoonia sediminum TaxID=1508389 RepID=A0A1M5SL41_9RHOB|nr:quinone-dependent dihydroorotate dehydrogenase [Cognatiyoonia sediminum]SHH38978.1 dihydroorotate oxidase A [Cognatiyoonia sediminum]